MVCYLYKVTITEKHNSSDNIFEATYTIALNTPPTENPAVNMTIAINEYLNKHNTNTKVYAVKNCEFIVSCNKKEIEEEYDYYFENKNNDNANIITRVKNIIGN